MSGSTSGATKDSCMSTASNLWSATEMRWNENIIMIIIIIIIIMVIIKTFV